MDKLKSFNIAGGLHSAILSPKIRAIAIDPKNEDRVIVGT